VLLLVVASRHRAAINLAKADDDGASEADAVPPEPLDLGSMSLTGIWNGSSRRINPVCFRFG
jgi:hypothetical protein